MKECPRWIPKKSCRVALPLMALAGSLGTSSSQLPPPEIDPRFAIAGPAAGLGPFYSYTWDAMSGPNPPDQTVPESFARVVGKLDNRHDGLSCNPCTSSDTQKIEAAEEHKIRDLLTRQINRGTTWIVGNEPNFYPKINATTYAEQFTAYSRLIKSLDPSAKIVTGGMLYIGWSGVSPDIVIPPETYMDTFLANISPADKPDNYAVHFYPSADGYIANNVNQAGDFKNYLAGKNEAGKPVWVTEFGMNYPASPDQAINYMDQMVAAFKKLGYTRWFWFIGTSEPGHESTALTANGQVTPIGIHYLALATLPRTLTACNADINQDHKVDIVDFSLLLRDFGKTAGEPLNNPRSDINKDGVVNIADFSLLLKYFGQSCTT